jgi:hypothetical protein
MRKRVCAVAVCLLAAAALEADAQSSRELGGVWLLESQTRGFPMSQWSPKELPFSAAGLARFNDNKPGKGPRQSPPAFGNDPIGGANPPGLYRTLIYSRPFELIQLPDKVVQTFEWAKVWRVIWTDGRDPSAALAAGPYWYGYSVGRWEGDVLVVETEGLDGRAWFDEWGTPFSDNARIQERWRRADADTIELTITVHDPDTYREPWTSDVKAYELQRKDSSTGEPLEVIFAPIDEVEFNSRIRDPAAGAPDP